MATKKVRCTLCDGSGFVTRIHKTETSCGIARAPCPRCHGTGTKAVPVTNADRIRAMSDDELLNLLSAPCPLLRRDDDKGCPNPKPCRECIAEWLKQPAEEVDT